MAFDMVFLAYDRYEYSTLTFFLLETITQYYVQLNVSMIDDSISWTEMGS